MHCPTVASAFRFRPWGTSLICGVCSTAFFLGFAVGTNSRAGEPSAAVSATNVSATVSGTAQHDDIPALIAKLGDDVFAVREAASNQLARQGIAAKPQLLAALESSDAEVRFRARHILEVVVEADFQKRLSAFSADVDGKQNLSMPGWSSFKRTMGSSQAARQVFVEMQQAEAALLESYEAGPKQAAEKLRAQAALDPPTTNARGRNIIRPTVTNLGSILAWLFVAGDPDVPLSDDITARTVMLPQNPVFQEAVLRTTRESNPQREVCRKIMGRWISRDDLNSTLMMRNLFYAQAFNLQEGVIPAVSILKQAQSPAIVKCNALMVLERFGGKEHLPLVEPLLTDHQLCFDTGGNTQPMQVQLGDVALVTTIVLSGQDPKNFGFERYQQSERALTNVNLNTIAFASDKDREAAFQKWQEWQAGQRQAMGENPAAKSGAEKTE
ncbi:MAG TPA: hypothetical protein VMJ32_08370 [Pirellulales bacterium]|nr:hypothetical protein [Pirellulales bacterium]